MSGIKVKTVLTDTQIANRVDEVNDHDRFSVFSFLLRDEEHMAKVLEATSVEVTSKDGSIFLGYVEDWDDSHYLVNLI